MPLLTIAISILAAGTTSFLFHLWQQRRISREVGFQSVISRLRTEVSELITELNGITERNIALLEDRIRALNESVDKASRMQKVLAIEKEKKDNADRVYSELGRNKAMDIPIELSLDPPLEPSSEPPPEPVIPPLDFDSLSVREKVLVFHRRGDSLDSIAGELGMSRGEVELVISLHDRTL